MSDLVKFPLSLLIMAVFGAASSSHARDMVIDHDPFPPFAAVPQALLMPQDAKITVDRFGNYLVDGKIRYMAGISNSTGNFDLNIKETEGYPESLNWLYQDVLTYESAQRLGFDTLSVFTPPVWLKKLDPDVAVAGQNPLNWQWTERMLSNRLPLLLDNTAFPWDHGSLRYSGQLESLRKKFPDEIFNRSTHTNHWVPYNIFHPEARNIYRLIWENGVEEMERHGGGPVFACELFNEPAYDDPSEYNRQLFATYLEKKFTTVERMNALFRSSFASFAEASALSPAKKNTPLSIEWGRFQEDGFTDLCRFGAEVVKQKAPGTLVCTQILGGNYYRCVPASNVNVFAICQYMDSISLPTASGLSLFTTIMKAPESSLAAPALPGGLSEGILMRHLFRGFADGKPIHSPETYARKSRQGNIDTVWLDLLRGSSITYFFSWYRGYPQWLPEKTAEGGRKLAEKMSYLLTNPYGYHPESLTGFLAGKDEIASLADFFVSRERFLTMPRPVALMHSLSSERYGYHEGEIRKNELVNYAAALEFAHFLPDAFQEEQLREKRAERYRALVAVGMTNSYSETLPELENYVRHGGVLIAARGLLQMDEYGNPRQSPLFAGLSGQDATGKTIDLRFSTGFTPDRRTPGAVRGTDDWRVAAAEDWTVLAGIGDTPALLTRKFGEGHVYVIAPRMQDYAIAAVLGGILARHGIAPALELYRSGKNDLAVNLEAHPGRSENLTAVFILNHDRYPKLSEAVLPGDAECGIDVRKKMFLPQVGHDRVFFVNDAAASTILCFGSKADLEKRFGALTPYGENELRADFLAMERKHEAYLASLQEEAPVFDADPANLVTIDLRAFANRSFEDSRPDDGEGGWTDQGRETCLEGVPWDTVTLRGIPCDLIRYDTNDNRSCIMLSSPKLKQKLVDSIDGIPVKLQASKLYFFHTSAWTGAEAPGTPLMLYRVHYADGSICDVPIRNQYEVGDWWDVKKPRNPSAHGAWMNSRKRGFYVYEWVNPEPEKDIRAIDVVSMKSRAIVAVIGISAELYTGKQTVAFDVSTIGEWGGVKAVAAGPASFLCVVGPESRDWSGCQIQLPSALKVTPELLKTGVIRMTLAGDKDGFGNPVAGFPGGVKIILFSNTIKKSREYKPVRSQGPLRVSIPLASLLDANANFTEINGIAFQYLGQAAVGFQVKNARIEFQQTAE